MSNPLDELALELEVAATARPHDPARYAAVLERAVQACKTDPAAAEWFDLGDLYLDLVTEYQTLKRYDDALASADAAVAAGLQMRPDARCLRAEILMRAGQAAEAERIWAAVRTDTPDDVWLYNTAGIEYADAGEHGAALDWLTKGLQLALRTGDPERVVAQLADFRQTSLDTLGLAADELQDEAATFLRTRTRAPEPAYTAARPMSVAWLPAGDYEQALGLWPKFAESELVAAPDGPLPHARYCWALQQRLIAYSEQGAPAMTIVPIRLAQFTAWCAEHGQPPESADTRSEYVMHRGATGGPDVIAWPPGRNQPCWCGSGIKYKKCCAAPVFVDRAAQK